MTIEHNLVKVEPNNMAVEQIVNVMTMPNAAELTHFTDTAKLLSTCPYYQKLGPGGILAIWLSAREMGLPPMMCLNGGMYTFSGAVTLSSQMMNMMIVRAGHRADVLKLDEDSCKIRFHRSDRQNDVAYFEYEYTVQMAVKAGLAHKDNWKKNTRDMLFSRALSGGARKFMPDVIMNAYIHGEIVEDEEFPKVNSSVVNLPNQLSLLGHSTSSIGDAKQIPANENCISSLEAEALRAIISQCPVSYANTIDTHLKTMNLTEYEQLSPVTWKKLMTRSELERDKYIRLLTKQEAAQLEGEQSGEAENE